jgi:hypothetical protein
VLLAGVSLAVIAKILGDMLKTVLDHERDLTLHVLG